VRRYMTHYKLTGFSPAAFTVNHIVNWFAHLGMAGDLSPATLSTYRSALGRWYLEKSSSPTHVAPHWCTIGLTSAITYTLLHE
jgi:hypothetical protein